MFDQISPTYDVVNRIMTMGLDQRWRRQLGRFLPKKDNLHVLDLATGTADVAISLVKQVSAVSRVTAVDPALKMLDIARKKVEKEGLSSHIFLEGGNAESLTYPDNTFDAITISFGVRNIENLSKGLDEMYRVLKPGGRLLILETSIPTNPVLWFLHLCYNRYVMPLLGRLVSRSSAYRYLNKTIETFPSGVAFSHYLSKAQFSDVAQTPLFFGTVSIYLGDKKTNVAHVH